MDLKSVKQLADLMEQYGLASVEVCEGEHKIALTKQGNQAAAAQVAGQPAPVAAPAAPQPEAQPTPQAAPEAPGEELKAPLVGVAYVAAKPGAAPFVQVGSKVKKGQQLCIIEAMKVMNEFTAPRDGEVSAVCFEDGQMVEYGQCLFRLL